MLEPWTLFLLFVLIHSVKGQVSIPTCCEVDDSVSMGFKCSGRMSKSDKHRVPKTIPFTIAQRLGLMNIGNNTQWVVKDVKCRHGSPQSIVKNFSSASGTPEFEFQSDGYLMLQNRSESADYLHVDQYCIYEITESKIVVKSCEAKCTGTEPCIRICCPLGTVFLLKLLPPLQCIPQKWFPAIYKNVAKIASQLSETELRALQPRYLYRPLPVWREHCQNNLIQLHVNNNESFQALNGIYGPAQMIRFRLNSQGSPLFRNEFRKWERLADERHCVAGAYNLEMQNFDPTSTALFTCSQFLAGSEDQVSGIYGPLAIMASTFSLITVLAYALLFEKQNVHGWTTMSHSTAVFFFCIFVGSAHITKEHDEFHNKLGCIIMAILAHYFFIANFTWLLMLSVDLWLTFRTISAPLARGGRGIKRFCLYSLTGWGLPLILVSISWALEVSLRDDPDSEVPVPLYGDKYCYVARHALWEFIYGPTCVLFILNILLFCWTSVTLYKFQQSTKIATQQINQERQSFLLFFKLFVVCGVLWTTEFLSFTLSGAHITWYIQIFDSANILQPVAIFFIFIFKWDFINALHEKYSVLRPIVFPARFILIRLRQRQRRNIESPVQYSKGDDTHVSQVSTLEATSTL